MRAAAAAAAFLLLVAACGSGGGDGSDEAGGEAIGEDSDISGTWQVSSEVVESDNPGISVKLSALHPRYEYVQRAQIMDELVPRLAALVEMARNSNIGFTIDAEEADRLDLSLDVIEAVAGNADLAAIVEALYARTGPWLSRAIRRFARIDDWENQHMRIIDAIAARDASEARRLMEADILWNVVLYRRVIT